MRRAARGITLGSVLMVAAFASMMAFVMASGTVFHLQFSSHTTDMNAARNLAESHISQTIYMVMQDPVKFARGGSDKTFRLEWREGAESWVSFDGDDAADKSVLCSVINQPSEEDEAPPPARRWPAEPLPNGKQYEIPPGGLLVAARATVDGVSAHGVAVVWFPMFPYAIASSGKVSSNGAMLVAAAPEGAPPSTALQQATGPGSLASNSLDPEAILLRTGAHVTGNALASGGIKLEPQAVVDGGVQPGTQPVGLPALSVPSLDPAALGMPDIQPVPSVMSAPRMSGFNRAPANVTVNGDLELEDGVLYVDGDLHVTGKVLGHGVILVSGNTTIDKGGSFSSDNTAAIASGGDVTITGTGADQSAFAGVVYAGGKVNASNITLLGSMVAAGPEAEIKLQSANAVHVPGYESVELNLATTQTSFTYPTTSDSPVWIGGPGCTAPGGTVKVNWLRYTDPATGQAVYSIADLPDVDPKPLPQFWDTLRQWLQMHGIQDSKFIPNWYNIHKLRSISDNNWYPISTFLQYLDDRGPPPKGTSSGPPVPTVSTTEGQFKFDLNKFISPADRLRVLLWQLD